jgi:hypothetical protein
VSGVDIYDDDVDSAAAAADFINSSLFFLFSISFEMMMLLSRIQEKKRRL